MNSSFLGVIDVTIVGCNLPCSCTGSIVAQAHLRNVFYRMGFDDEGIVALSGAHTIGRAKKVGHSEVFYSNV